VGKIKIPEGKTLTKKKAVDNSHKIKDFQNKADLVSNAKGAVIGVLPSVNPSIASIALEQYSYAGQEKEINQQIQILENLIKKNIKLSKKEDKVNAKEKNISRLLQLIRRIEKIE
jgi:hypothetical protein